MINFAQGMLENHRTQRSSARSGIKALDSSGAMDVGLGDLIGARLRSRPSAWFRRGSGRVRRDPDGPAAAGARDPDARRGPSQAFQVRRVERAGSEQLVCAAPLYAISMESYKRLHLKHHLDPLVADDPDLSLIGGYPIGRASFRRKLVRDLLGISYFKVHPIFYLYVGEEDERPTAPRSSPRAIDPARGSGVFCSSRLLTAL